MSLFLTSLSFAGLGTWLGDHGAGGTAVLIDNASRQLADGDAIVATAEATLAAEGVVTRRTDVRREDPARLEQASAIIMTGGDPFRLLADLRASGADRALAIARDRGVPIAGQSAGAMVCSPNLEAVRITSPFPAPDDLDLGGLALTDTLTLPHHDRPGRADLHRQASLQLASHRTLFALWDDEALVIDGDGWSVLRGSSTTRRVRHDDVEAVADLFGAAARQAWSSFLDAGRLARAGEDLDAWSQRVSLGGHRFLVSEDEHGLTGFVACHQAASRDDSDPVGEIDMLYTHPRVWGSGVGRRLLHRATWNLLCEGYREAILWTEARNRRARAVYGRAGWVTDGAVDERDYLGLPIRNLRHRLDLTRHAGGP